MSEQGAIKLIEALYVAFKERDIPTILGHLSQDVEWTQPGAGLLPWGGAKQGRAAVGGFFRVLDEQLAYSEFVPEQFIAQGDQVVVLGRSTATLRKRGLPVAQDWVMVWRVSDGQVSSYRYYDDTLLWARALEGS